MKTLSRIACAVFDGLMLIGLLCVVAAAFCAVPCDWKRKTEKECAR